MAEAAVEESKVADEIAANPESKDIDMSFEERMEILGKRAEKGEFDKPGESEPAPEKKDDPEQEAEEPRKKEDRKPDEAEEPEEKPWFDEAPPVPTLGDAEPEESEEEPVRDEIDELVDADEPPADGDPKAGKAWARVKQENRELKEKLKSGEERIAEAQSSAIEEADGKLARMEQTITELRKEKDDLGSRLALVDYRNSQEYKSKVEAPETAVMESAAKIAGKYENVTPQMIMSALKSGDASIDDFAEKYDISVSHIAKMGALSAELDKAESARKSLDENASEYIKSQTELSEQQQQQTMAARQESFSRQVESKFKAEQNDNPLFRPVAGNDAWNRTLSDMLTALSDVDVASVDEPRVAEALVKAEFYHQSQPIISWLQKKEKAQGERISEMEKRISKLSAASPSTGAGASKSDDERKAEANKEDDSLSFEEAIERRAKNWG